MAGGKTANDLQGMRLVDAQEVIELFEEDFGVAHLCFAQHAAFPLTLTPDLLYRLWINFQRDIHDEKLSIPWIAVADLLLSSLCKEVGHELYEMDITVRVELLNALKGNSAFGMTRIYELSDFLLSYVHKQLTSSSARTYKLAEAQQWTALAYTRPEQVTQELANALNQLSQDSAEHARVTSLIETLDVLAEPLATFEGFAPLLARVKDGDGTTHSRVVSKAFVESSVVDEDNIQDEEAETWFDSLKPTISNDKELQRVMNVAKTNSGPLKLFYCYAHEDKALRNTLDIHLSSMKRQGLVTVWYDREIVVDTNWEYEIDTHLSSAHIILLLVSARFLASDYCYGIEMQKALQRDKEGTARVVPILLRPVDWEGTPFSHLPILPTEAKPVTRWVDRDDAFEDIAKSLRKVIKDLRDSLKKEALLEEGHVLNDLKRYEEALINYEQVIQLDPSLAIAYNGKGYALNGLKRYKEALVLLDKAISLGFNLATVYNSRGYALRYLKRYEDAIAAYNQAINLDPNYAQAYNGRGNTLRNLKRYAEALKAYNQAINLDPNYAQAYYGKGRSLRTVGRYEEAIDAFEQVIRLDSNFVSAYNSKGYALHALKRYKEALVAFEQAIQLNPNYAQAYYNKGNTLQKMNRNDEAQTVFSKANQLSDSNIES